MCKTIGCSRHPHEGQDFCPTCLDEALRSTRSESRIPLSELYPQYYKDVSHLDEVDVYAVHHVFHIQDPSGAIQHASKKLLLSGVRTGGKSAYDDVREARDTLTRWLQLNQPGA